MLIYCDDFTYDFTRYKIEGSQDRALVGRVCAIALLESYALPGLVEHWGSHPLLFSWVPTPGFCPWVPYPGSGPVCCCLGYFSKFSEAPTFEPPKGGSQICGSVLFNWVRLTFSDTQLPTVFLVPRREGLL